MIAPEFSYPVAVAEMGGTQRVDIAADGAARARIAERLNLISLDDFHVRADVRLIAGGVAVHGMVKAKLEQRCAATDLPLPVDVDAPFDLQYLRDAGTADSAEAEEVEISGDDCDVLPLEDEAFDLGEAAVQSLSLALDPFPRHRDADRLLAEKGIHSEAQAGPFAALAALRKT